MQRTAAAIFVLTLLPSVPRARAAQPSSVIDDSDLAGRPAADPGPRLLQEAHRKDGKPLFRATALPGALAAPPASAGRVVVGALSLTDPQGRKLPGRRVEVLLVTDSGDVLSRAQTDETGAWSMPIPDGAAGSATVRFRLENPMWSIQGAGGDPYEWEAATVDLSGSGPVSAGSYTLDPDTANGKIGYIHLQLLQGMNVFEREGIKLDFWKKQLQVNYPGQGDYTSPWNFSLNLSQAEAWDVNLHEFGHAVMAAGIRQSGGGGRHYIDRCYDEALAWSEGWASFFSALAGISRDDADAKFQYMVPRRAPIRVENVPADVCEGPTNEWRVTAALWDLYDAHVDGPDVIALPFARIWGALQGRTADTFMDAWRLIEKGLSPQEIQDGEAALRWNTILPPTADAPKAGTPLVEAAAEPVRAPARDAAATPASLRAAPDWDGLEAR